MIRENRDFQQCVNRGEKSDKQDGEPGHELHSGERAGRRELKRPDKQIGNDEDNYRMP